jgi:hypothetical protein
MTSEGVVRHRKLLYDIGRCCTTSEGVVRHRKVLYDTKSFVMYLNVWLNAKYYTFGWHFCEKLNLQCFGTISWFLKTVSAILQYIFGWHNRNPVTSSHRNEYKNSIDELVNFIPWPAPWQRQQMASVVYFNGALDRPEARGPFLLRPKGQTLTLGAKLSPRGFTPTFTSRGERVRWATPLCRDPHHPLRWKTGLPSGLFSYQQSKFG